VLSKSGWIDSNHEDVVEFFRFLYQLSRFPPISCGNKQAWINKTVIFLFEIEISEKAHLIQNAFNAQNVNHASPVLWVSESVYTFNSVFFKHSFVLYNRASHWASNYSIRMAKTSIKLYQLHQLNCIIVDKALLSYKMWHNFSHIKHKTYSPWNTSKLT